MAEELLLAHGNYISKFTLIPGGRGHYEVTINGELVYSKLQTGRFPELQEIREKVAARLS